MSQSDEDRLVILVRAAGWSLPTSSRCPVPKDRPAWAQGLVDERARVVEMRGVVAQAGLFLAFDDARDLEELERGAAP